MGQRFDFAQRANAAYIERMQALYRRDPSAVPAEWAAFFAGFELAGRGASGGAQSGGAYGLIMAYREFGHLVARLDPLGGSPDSHPLLELSAVGLSEEDLNAEADASALQQSGFHGTLRELREVLHDTYCSTIGVEYMQIPDREQRDWLQQQMERRRNRPSFGPEDRIRLLSQLLTADAFEQFLHVKYVGQKRFSLEGAATLIPMLDALVEGSAALGVEQLVIGMPHRGRLNVLAHIVGKPLDLIFSEFESSFAPGEVQGHGDVKYHLGYSRQHLSRRGHPIYLNMHFNPSHLEFVNPVVLGSLRARQRMMSDPDGARGAPVLIHGDAAMAGEGIVPETLMLSQMPSYRTGGTIHIVVNNQIGFTTSPENARTTRYATDIARVIGAPVFHVNGDDPEAATHVMHLAVAYRAKFRRDVFIDLVCYRRHGHNELDDPTFTQPVMYRTIAGHTPVSRRYAERLLAEGVLDPARLETIEAEQAEGLREAHTRAHARPVQGDGPAKPGGAWKGLQWAGEDWGADTRVPRAAIDTLMERMSRLPEGFRPHRKIAHLIEERGKMLAEDRIDWGLGEALALGTLLAEGTAVRLTGQDTGRGTFSHRHAALRDGEDGHLHVPLQHLAADQGRFDLIDTILSEAAALGFEYGYSVADPNTLTVWEAQFGDFSNVAQVYIDQFMASGESKWGRMSGLVLLLPHGYEGQGPEHSSARLERFLELCANGNMQVCNLTTPGQLFHALRRQIHRPFRKPLVIMSPKSLLRHRAAVSPVQALTDGAFETVIDDVTMREPGAARRVLLVSGKFYYALLEARDERGIADTALVRVEQLYPFPRRELHAVLARYPEARDVRWVQEEPENMGAWRNLRHRLEAALPEGRTLTRATRLSAASPATGYYLKHVEQEQALLDLAFGDAPPAAAKPARGRREALR
jgi:2-oxoglutarate dehydrogenase E1 component